MATNKLSQIINLSIIMAKRKNYFKKIVNNIKFFQLFQSIDWFEGSDLLDFLSKAIFTQKAKKGNKNNPK